MVGIHFLIMIILLFRPIIMNWESIENWQSSLDNINEIDWVKKIVEKDLNDLNLSLFYEKDTDNNKIKYNLNTVNSYLELQKDKTRSDIIWSKNQVTYFMALQIALESMWYDVDKIDWKFWPNLRKCIRSFQKDYGLKIDWYPWKIFINKYLEIKNGKSLKQNHWWDKQNISLNQENNAWDTQDNLRNQKGNTWNTDKTVKKEMDNETIQKMKAKFWKNFENLPNIRSLDCNDAQYIIDNYKWDELDLSKVEIFEISEVADILSQFKWSILNLSSLMNINTISAKYLMNYEWILVLSWIKVLQNKEIARCLASFKWKYLDLSWLNYLLRKNDNTSKEILEILKTCNSIITLWYWPIN